MRAASSLVRIAGAGAGVGRRRLADLAASLGLFALFPLAALVTQVPATLPVPLCAFRLVTGAPCPLCGMTHAFAMAFAGNFTPAFGHNPLWPIAAGMVLLTAGIFAVDAACPGERARGLLRRLSRRWWVGVAGLAVFEAIRLW